MNVLSKPNIKYLIPILFSFFSLISGYVYTSFSQTVFNATDTINNEENITKENLTNKVLFVKLNPLNKSYPINTEIQISGKIEDNINKLNLTDIPIITQVFSNDKEILKTISITNQK